MWQLIPKNGLPDRRFRWCCKVLKENGGHDRLVVTGVRWAESARRSKRRMVETCNLDPTKRYLNPVIDWSDDEIWDYIHNNKLPYCTLYDEGFQRIGCIMCPMANNNQRLSEQRRWPKIADSYKRACDKLFKRKKDRGLSLRPEWTCGNDMYESWMHRRESKKVDPDQTVIFE